MASPRPGNARPRDGSGAALDVTAGRRRPTLRPGRRAVAFRESDPHLSAEDIALGYKQLLEVERGWRDMKTTLHLRPVFHRLEERIRAHVILCWLALLLVRIAETTTGHTWNHLREHLQELHVGTFEGPAGKFCQRTELTSDQRDILTALNVLAAVPRDHGRASRRQPA